MFPCMIELLGRLTNAKFRYRKRHGGRKTVELEHRWWNWWDRQCLIPTLPEPELVPRRRRKR